MTPIPAFVHTLIAMPSPTIATPLQSHPDWFDWLGFLAGGATVTLMSAGINSVLAMRKAKQEKVQVIRALLEEINANVTNCQDIVNW